jgi:hypothetical protein
MFVRQYSDTKQESIVLIVIPVLRKQSENKYACAYDRLRTSVGLEGHD